MQQARRQIHRLQLLNIQERTYLQFSSESEWATVKERLESKSEFEQTKVLAEASFNKRKKET